MRLCATAVILLLAGCGHNPPKPPKIVYVTVEKIVPVPEELTRPCPAVRPVGRTVKAVVEAYNDNVTIMADCDNRMTKIRSLGE